jgi:hypothetical protein
MSTCTCIFYTWWWSNKWPKCVVRCNKLNVQKFRCCDFVVWIVRVMNLYYMLRTEFHFVHWDCKTLRNTALQSLAETRKVMNKILETITELWCEAQVWPSHHCAACIFRRSKSSNITMATNHSPLHLYPLL